MAVKIDLPRNLHGNRLHVVYADEGDRKPLSTIKARLNLAAQHEPQQGSRQEVRKPCWFMLMSSTRGIKYTYEKQSLKTTANKAS